MPEVDLATFAAAHAAGAVVIDVRQPFEYVAGHIPGAWPVPLAQLPEHTASLPRTRPVYVICASGRRSLGAADLLSRAGIEAYSVAGGTNAWACAGRRVIRGGHPGA